MTIVTTTARKSLVSTSRNIGIAQAALKSVTHR